MILHTYTTNQYTLWFLRNSPDKTFKLKVTEARSDKDVAYLHPLTNGPIHLKVSEMHPRQTFPATHSTAHLDTMGKKLEIGRIGMRNVHQKGSMSFL